MADNRWYGTLVSNATLTQGELIFGCPVVTWKETSWSEESEINGSMIDPANVDVVVMSQDCDLAHGHIRYVILCPIYPLTEYKRQWEQIMKDANQNPSTKAWSRWYESVRKGTEWSLSLLNAPPLATTEMYIVDFKEIFSLPLGFLQPWVESQERRIYLVPPYREHLAQSFARFFMRVGLPDDIPPLS